MQKNQLTVNILDAKFTIKSENEARYLEEIVEYLKFKIDEIRQGFSLNDPMKISLLAALNLVDELFKTRQRNSSGGIQEALEIEKITERLITKINASLTEN